MIFHISDYSFLKSDYFVDSILEWLLSRMRIVKTTTTTTTMYYYYYYYHYHHHHPIADLKFSDMGPMIHKIHLQ